MSSLRDMDVFESMAHLTAKVKRSKAKYSPTDADKPYASVPSATWMLTPQARYTPTIMQVAHANHHASKPPLRALNVGEEIRQLIRAHALKSDLAKVFETQ